MEGQKGRENRIGFTTLQKDEATLQGRWREMRNFEII
jgi:hypothetical protein